MAPRDINITWAGEQPSTFTFVERSGNILTGLTHTEQQRLERQQRRQIHAERVASRPPLRPTLVQGTGIFIPRHLQQYTRTLPQRQGETHAQWIARLNRRHTQPVYPGERFGRPMR